MLLFYLFISFLFFIFFSDSKCYWYDHLNMCLLIGNANLETSSYVLCATRGCQWNVKNLEFLWINWAFTASLYEWQTPNSFWTCSIRICIDPHAMGNFLNVSCRLFYRVIYLKKVIAIGSSKDFGLRFGTSKSQTVEDACLTNGKDIYKHWTNMTNNMWVWKRITGA